MPPVEGRVLSRHPAIKSLAVSLLRLRREPGRPPIRPSSTPRASIDEDGTVSFDAASAPA